MSEHLSHFALSTVNSFFPMTTNLHFHLMIGLMKRPILSEQANVFGKMKIKYFTHQITGARQTLFQ